MGAYIHRFLAGVLGVLLAACGGGGGGDGGGGGGSGWTPGTFLPSSSFAGLCFAPRSGPDPFTGQLDDQGTVLDENNFLRSFSDETYLWYDEITDRDPGNFNNPFDYFDLLRTTATTASGADKDKFHFFYPTDEWFQLSQSGQSVGYGAQWIILSPDPPRELVVAYTEPGSPATAPTVNLARGARVLTVDGADLVNGGDNVVDTLNAGLFPETIGEPHTFTVRDLGDPNTRSITMSSAQVTAEPVQEVKVIPTPSGAVGYMLFNDHIATAEDFLVDAVEQLDAAGVVDLVLDIRYNGGGFLDIASELAYMIAGAGATTGQTFER
ncbi:MAG: S41 family peptidase, partial [Woeseiaceae bacterium]